MHRRKMGHKESRTVFRKGNDRVHVLNFLAGWQRGGIRL